MSATMQQPSGPANMKAIMAASMVVPFSNIIRNHSDDREDKLRTIIANIQAQNTTVRRNIIALANTTISSSEGGSATSAHLHPQPTQTPQAQQQDSDEQPLIPTASLKSMNANLYTPYDKTQPQSSDVYVLALPSSSSTAQKPNHAAGDDDDEAETDDPNINAALTTFDAHARKTLQYYFAALNRARAAKGLGPETLEAVIARSVSASGRRPSRSAGKEDGDGDVRMQVELDRDAARDSTTATEGGASIPAAPGSAVDKSRDPRLARRDAAAAAASRAGPAAGQSTK